MATVFEVSAPIGMFRTPYTTTSSVSYPFPPPTAVAGMIGAILGIDHGASKHGTYALYWKEMKGTQIAIQIMNQVKFMRTGINFWNTKSRKLNDRTQIKHIFLKNPRFRIFVQGSLENRLDHALKEGISHFPVYMGVAYAIAQCAYLGRFQPFPSEDRTSIDSVIPLIGLAPDIDMEKTKSLNQTLVPFKMDETRKLISTCNVLYRQEQGSITLIHPIPKGIQQIAGSWIVWFNPF